MIYQPLSKIVRSTELALDAGATIAQDGVALSGVMTAGKFGVRPSTAAAEKFVGFATTRTSAAPFALVSVVKVETLTAVAGVVTVSRTPVASTTRVNLVTTNASGTVSDVTGKAVTITSGAAQTYRVTYRTLVTAAEAEMLAGNTVPGGYAGNKWGLVGVAQQGVIFTSQFDTAIDWSASTPPAIQLGAAGQLTNGGSGTTLDAYVIHAPTAEYPFLGISFSAAG